MNIVSLIKINYNNKNVMENVVKIQLIGLNISPYDPLDKSETNEDYDLDLKNQIDNLDNLSEEQLLMLEKRLENEDELIELRNISNLEEINRQNENTHNIK